MQKPAKLNVVEALRYANHDYANDLQILSMYMDLGKTEAFKTYITKSVANMQTISTINRMQSVVLAEWLLTMKWRYTMFHVTLSVKVEQPINKELVDVVEFADSIILQVAEQVDVYEQHSVHIDICVAQLVTITMHITGVWQTPIRAIEKNERFMIDVQQNEATALRVVIRQGVN